MWTIRVLGCCPQQRYHSTCRRSANSLCISVFEEILSVMCLSFRLNWRVTEVCKGYFTGIRCVQNVSGLKVNMKHLTSVVWNRIFNVRRAGLDFIHQELIGLWKAGVPEWSQEGFGMEAEPESLFRGGAGYILIKRFWRYFFFYLA